MVIALSIAFNSSLDICPIGTVINLQSIDFGCSHFTTDALICDGTGTCTGLGETFDDVISTTISTSEYRFK